MKFNISAASNVGRVRTNNEDMVLVNDIYVRDSECQATFDTDQHDRLLFALADGMGGHNAGEVASSDTLHNLQYFFGDLPIALHPEQVMDEMRKWLDSISLTIDSKSKSAPKFNGMGTTLVSIFLYDNQYYWMNCGDSRFLHLRNGRLQQISKDHSLDAITGRTEHSYILTNCIGGGCQDCYLDIHPCTTMIQPGDTLLLCSDGLYDMVTDLTVSKHLGQGDGANDLCRLACEAGGADNVSCCVIRIEQ